MTPIYNLDLPRTMKLKIEREIKKKIPFLGNNKRSLTSIIYREIKRKSHFLVIIKGVKFQKSQETRKMGPVHNPDMYLRQPKSSPNPAISDAIISLFRRQL